MDWIKIEKRCKMPRKGQTVDLWHSEYGRLPDYKLVKNFHGKGNNFFRPINAGISCIRYESDDLDGASLYWMPTPKPPKIK